MISATSVQALASWNAKISFEYGILFDFLGSTISAIARLTSPDVIRHSLRRPDCLARWLIGDRLRMAVTVLPTSSKLS